MQVKKVFSVDTIKINQKPPHVKPKYKTYRELLDLDRPKKILQHQSDDENDDFLQKLMKKERKKQQEQKKKQKAKKQSANSKQLSQAQQSQPSNNQAAAHLQLQQKKASKPNSRLSSAKSKQNQHNDSIDYLDKKIKTEEFGSNSKEKKNIAQNGQMQFSELKKSSNHDKNQPFKVLIRKTNFSQDNLKKNYKLHSHNKKDSKIQNQEQLYDNLIRLSKKETSSIIKNNFITSHKLRISVGLKELQKNTHQEKQMIKNTEHLIQTKLNPQKRLIEHKINPQKYVKQNQISYSQRAKDYLLKSAGSPPVEMLLMGQSPKNYNQSKYKSVMIARKSLFKSTYQENLFIKSLKRQ